MNWILKRLTDRRQEVIEDGDFKMKISLKIKMIITRARTHARTRARSHDCTQALTQWSSLVVSAVDYIHTKNMHM